MTSEQRQDCFRAATRFLHGHGRFAARHELERIAAEAGEETPDFYGVGAAIAGLEAEVARLLGKPSAVFLPSGTMAQQIALRIWSERAGGAPVAFHPTSHLEIHEQKGYAFLHGLRAHVVGERQRLIGRADLDKVPGRISALLLELPQREIGGPLPSWDALLEQAAWAKERGGALHMDGARLWESQPFYARPLSEIAGVFDTVYVSFYKTLGALAGAALAGPADFIAEVRVWQRRQGGNLVTLFPYVLSARLALRERLPKIPAYVARARTLAATLTRVAGLRVFPEPPPTNMMHVAVPGDGGALLDASASIAKETGMCLFNRLRPSDIPGHHVIELAAGDGALEIKDDEVRERFSRVAEAGAVSG